MRARKAVEGSASADHFDLVAYVGNVFRLDMLGILISAALVGWLACMIYRDVRRHRSTDNVATIDAPSRQAGSVIAAFFAATAVFTFTAGMLETVSWVRISSFVLPLMIAISAIVGQIVTVSVGRARRVRILAATVAPILLTSVLLVQAYEQHKTTLLAVLHNALRFADGRYSIHLTPTGIRPGGRFSIGRRSIPACTKPGKRIGPGKRIWSFNMNTYCMLPGCHFESVFASSMSKHREEILFGPPEHAEQVLRREGIELLLHFNRHPCAGRVAVHAAVLAGHDPEPFGCRVDRWARCVAHLEGTGRRTSIPGVAQRYRKAVTPPNWYLSDCANEGTNFGGIGRRVASEIAKGSVRAPKFLAQVIDEAASSRT